MSDFWIQFLGTCAAFAVIEGGESILRTLLPGRSSAVYTRLKLAVGLPFAVLAGSLFVARDAPIQWVAVGLGIAVSAAVVLLFFRDRSGSDRKDAP